MEIKRRYKIMIGEPKRVAVHLVGCGGTGSFLALHLARMAYDARRDGLVINLTFHDGDRVELKNVGRQNFIEGEVGENKALALARRYSLAFGLEIEARPVMFDCSTDIINRSEFRVVIGAVDNPAARDAIKTVVGYRDGGTWWLDAGNHEYAGQVLLGDRQDLESPEISPLGWCSGLPLPSVVAPELLRPVKGSGGKSCAELLADGAQSLMINQAMAGWAATMLTRLVLSRDLDFWQTWVDLRTGSVKSVGIYKEAFDVEAAVSD